MRIQSPLSRRLARALTRTTALVVLAATVVACGGGDDDPSPAAALVGPAGATVDGPNGARLVVPANALAQPTSIAIAMSDAGAPALPSGHVVLGSTFALTPHGTAFAQPATVSVPFDPALLPAGETPVLMKTNATQTGWDPVVGTTVSGSTLQAPIGSFSWVVVALPPVLPTIRTQPLPQAVVAPAAATFAVFATGPTSSGILFFQWLRNGVSIPGADRASYTTDPTSVAADDGAIYSVTVTNLAGTVTSGNAPLTVTPGIVAPTITQEPGDLTLVVGATASFSVTAAGTSPTYRWQRSDAPGLPFADILGANAATYSFGPVAMADSGARFQVLVENAAGAVSSRIATLTVTAAPAATSLGRIAAGGRFSLAVNAAGVPYSWGNDSASQLGNGVPDANRNTAGPFGTLTDVRSLSAGQEYHGIAVRNDGTAWAWGYRGNVDCAVGSVASTPFKIDYAIDILAASAGYDHTLLLRSDGRVLSFGCNHSGQLGRPGMPPPMTPLAIVQGLAPNIIAVAAGEGYSLALDANGDVWSWGRSNPADRSGSGSPTPVRLAGLSNVIAIAAAREHALALRRDGAVLAWGSNRNGKLGDGTEVDRVLPTPTLLASQITAIAAGGENSLALRADAIVLSWGINETGQLGSGSALPGYRATPAPVSGLTDVVAISCGSGSLGHSLALRRDGSVWAWGHNDAGQLGDGSTTFRLAPVVVTGLNLN